MGKIKRQMHLLLTSIFDNDLFVRLGVRDYIRCHVLLKRERHYKQLTEEQKRVELIGWYYTQTGEKLDLENPRNFNQKIQWLKLYDNTPQKTILSDKFLVRQWVADTVGNDYLIPLYGVWDRAEKISFEELPTSFVLKANHGSGMNHIVKDKSKENLVKLRKIANKWLETPYDMSSLEQQYFLIPRKILAEMFIEQSDGNLLDYKVHCFNGRAKYIQVIGDRDIAHHTAKEAYMNINWDRIYDFNNKYDQYVETPPKPICLDEMVLIAEKLSKDFIYVRVDLYIIDDKIKFGEMTFTPAAGIGKWGAILTPQTGCLMK